MKTMFMSYSELCRTRVAFMSTFSGVVGYLLSTRELSAQIVLLALGIFLLACGSSALNQYQERDTDAEMPRTCSRPLPSGRIRPADAIYFSAAMMFSGCSALLLTGSLSAPLLGLLAVVWYNGVYTFLKRKSAFAFVPGALTGAMPPAIGWASAGAGVDTKLLMICFFFFMWQVPHSWLLIMKYGREYEQAGLPSLSRVFTPLQMQRIIFSWIFATTLSCMLMSAGGVLHYIYVNISLLLLSSWIIWNGLRPLLRSSAGYSPMQVFKKINYYLLIVMLLMSADRIFT